MMTTHLRWQVVILIAVTAWPLQASAISQFVIFGDSLSDTGNVATATGGQIPAAPYYQGRFSNGPAWHEWTGAFLGIPGSQAVLQGGPNYAIGGAETGFNPGWGITAQTLAYLPLNTPSPDELFVVWGGGNDYLNGQQDPLVPVRNLALNILSLSATGAKQFLVPNLPPLGQTPRFIGSSDETRLDTLIDTHNQLLEQRLQAIEQLDPSIEIHRLNIAGLFEILTASPETFGFTNITDPAYDPSTQTVAPNANDYIYWDEIHPTGTSHAWIGLAAAAGLANSLELELNPQVLNFWVGYVGLSTTSMTESSSFELTQALNDWGGSVGLSTASVPEPSSLSIVGVATILLIRRRRPAA